MSDAAGAPSGAPISTAKDKAAEAWENAADLLEKDGWIQGNYRGKAYPNLSPDQDKSGRCAIGALSAGLNAMGIPREHPERVSLFQTAVDAFHRRVGESVAAWNDGPKRTKQQVLDTIRAAAKELRR